MVNWSEINPVLIALVSDLLRKPTAPEWEAEWLERREANRMISPEQGGAVYLKITSCVPVGDDEFRNEMRTVVDENGAPVLDENDEEITDLHEVIVGFRRFNLQVQAWESEHSDAQWSINTLEKLRTRLIRTSSMARLRDVNVDLTDFGPSRKVTQTIGGRRWSIATMDITLTAAFTDADNYVPIGVIEHVELTSHAGIDGEDAPSPPNSGPETLPPLP